MATVRDISGTVRARRAVARSGAVARVVGYPVVVLAGVNVLLGRLPGLVLVVLGVILLWSAKRMVSGERIGALVVAGVSLVLVALDLLALVGLAKDAWSTETLLGLLGLAALGIPTVWLASGAYYALKHREPAVFRSLSRSSCHRGGSVRALLLRRRRPGVMRPLVGSIILLLLWIAFTPVTNGLIGIVFGPPTASLYRRARVRAALDVKGVLVEDARPPVLYLRSFADEDLMVRPRWHWRRSFIENITAWSERLEEVVARQLAIYGPVVAIGLPGERETRLGAAREYVSDDEWRHTIVERMEMAGVIAVSLGKGAGLRWELTTAANIGVLQKCVFIFPKVDAQELQGRWETLTDAIRAEGSIEDATVDVTKALTATRIGRGVHVTRGRRRNEWHYEVALMEAVEQIAAVRQV